MQTETFNWELVDAVAESIGVAYFTRRKWRDRNRVPVHWWQTLTDASDGKLTADEFQKLVTPAPAPNPAEVA